jgi:hypothetical protein
LSKSNKARTPPVISIESDMTQDELGTQPVVHGTVRLKVQRYSSVAELSGAAGTLGQKLSWPEMLAIAYDNRTIRRPRRKLH